MEPRYSTGLSGTGMEETLSRGTLVREDMWTQSVAVGSRHFVETIETKLGSRAKKRKVSGAEDRFALCEPQVPFGRSLDE